MKTTKVNSVFLIVFSNIARFQVLESCIRLYRLEQHCGSQILLSLRCFQERVTLSEDNLPPETIAGFVTCLHDGNWWLACVLEVTQEVRLTFLHPPDPSSSFRYPQSQDIRTVPIENILTLVDPRIRTGRVYTLMKKDISYASKKLHIVSQN